MENENDDLWAMNNERARRANEALATYANRDGFEGESQENYAHHLLADFMHFCDAEGFSFQDIYERARDSYLKEITDQPLADASHADDGAGQDEQGFVRPSLSHRTLLGGAQ